MHQERTAVEYHYLSLFSLLAIGDLLSKGFIGTYPTNCAPPCPWSVTFYTSSTLVKNFVQPSGDGCLTWCGRMGRQQAPADVVPFS